LHVPSESGRRPPYPKAGARSKQPLIREAPWSAPAFWRFEPNSNESGIIIVRPAANTTAIVRGKNNTTGNALVEVYILPPEAREEIAQDLLLGLMHSNETSRFSQRLPDHRTRTFWLRNSCIAR